MKVSVLLKPRKTGITQSLVGYTSVNFNQFNGVVNRNLLIDRVPIDLVDGVYNELREQGGPHSVILGVSIKNGLGEIKRIESLFINEY